MGEKEVQEGRWSPFAKLARDISQRCQGERVKAVKAGRAPDITKKLLERNKNVWNAAARTPHLVAVLDQDWEIGNRNLHLGSCLLELAIRHCTLGGKPVFERSLVRLGI